MKKSSLAIAISTIVASQSVLAFDILDKDGININMNGDIDLIIQNETSNHDGTEIETNFDDLDFDFTWKLNDKVNFVAATDWTVESDVDETVENDQSWAGLEIGVWGIRAGTLEDSIDPLGIEGFENVDMGRASGDQDGSGTKMEQAILVEYESDGLWVSGTYVHASEDDSIPSRYAFAAEKKLGKLTIAGGIGQEESPDETTTVDFYQFQAEYDFGALEVGGLFSSQSIEVGSDTTDTTGVQLDVQYKLNSDLTLMAGYETITHDESGNDDYVAMAVGAIYKFNKFAKLYLEAGTYDGTYIQGKSTGPSEKPFDDDNAVAMMLSLDF